MAKTLLLILLVVLAVLPLVESQQTDYQSNKSSAFLEVNDIYTFNHDGHFNRRSILWLRHNNKNESMDLVFSQMFPNTAMEKQQVLGNITYNLYWNWILDQTITKNPQEDFSPGETISEVLSLEYGNKAHMERLYSGYTNPTNVNLALNLELNYDNPKCENLKCGDYNLVYFNRIVKIEKNRFFGLLELNIDDMLPQPDIIYDDGNYRVYSWENFPLDIDDFKSIDLKFSYNYKIPTWLFWTILFTIVSIIVTWKLSKLGPKRYYCTQCEKYHEIAQTEWYKHINLKKR